MATAVPAAVVPSALFAVTARVPALIEIAPAYAVFAPDRVSVPAPFLISAPLVVVIVPLIAVLPVPSTVRFRVAPVTELAALSVSVPASDWISALPASVTVPPQVLLPLRLRSAPSPATPVPRRLSASAPTVIPPCIPSVAPLATVTPAVAAPSAEALAATKVPAFTFVTPL